MKKMIYIEFLLSAVIIMAIISIICSNTENKVSNNKADNYETKKYNDKINETADNTYKVNTQEFFDLVDSYAKIAISDYSFLKFSSNSKARSTHYEITISSNTAVSKIEFDEIKKSITKTIFENVKKNHYSGKLVEKNNCICINFYLFVKEDKKVSKDWVLIDVLGDDLKKDFEEYYTK